MPYSEIVQLERASGNGNRKTYTKVSDISIFIQPQDPSLASADVTYTKQYKAFTEGDVDIRENDRIFRKDMHYYVSGVQDFYFGSFPHKEIILTHVL